MLMVVDAQNKLLNCVTASSQFLKSSEEKVSFYLCKPLAIKQIKIRFFGENSSPEIWNGNISAFGTCVA
jgi:hypothetical protein